MLAKGAASWHSRMQAVTASSTLEADDVALSETVKGVLFLIQMQDFIKPLVRIDALNVFENNEGTVKLALNKNASRRTKHIDVKHHLVRDACDAGKVTLVYIRTDDQHMALFLELLGRQKFYNQTKAILNVVQNFIPGKIGSCESKGIGRVGFWILVLESIQQVGLLYNTMQIRKPILTSC